MCVGGRTRSGQRPRGAGRTERGRARFGRIGRPSSFRDGRDRGRAIESIDRRLRACRKTPPEHARVSAPPGRACLKWRAARPDPPLFGSRVGMPRGCASRGEASSRARERRLDSPDATRDESGRRPPRSDRARPRRFDPIATCLVPRDRFSGRRADQGARTHLLCPLPACGREGLYKTRKTRRRTRVPFVSVTRGPVRPLWRSTAVRRRFGELEAKLALILRVFETANPTRSRPSSRLRRPAHVRS